MRNQIYRGVRHATKTNTIKQISSSLTYRGVSHKHNDDQGASKLNARMNYRGLSYSRV